MQHNFSTIMNVARCYTASGSCNSLVFFVLILGCLQLFTILSQQYGTNARELICRNMEVQQKNVLHALDTAEPAADSFQDKNETVSQIAKPETPFIDSEGPIEFEGVRARAFLPYDHPPPCFEPDEDWRFHQSDPAQTGFLFVKPFKTGSSTASGLNLRIARNVATRLEKDFDVCKARSDHVWASGKYADRLREQSFMWTVVRNPTSRIVSQFFHFRVSRGKIEPTDRNFINYVTKTGPIDMIHDYYLNALSLEEYKRGTTDPVATANHILEAYDFVGITERMDESAVALAMILNVPIGDLLYLTAKGHGGYDDGGGRTDNVCTFIWPSFVSSGMQAFLESDEWKEKSHWDTVFYQAANRSLDLTIDKLGREKFYRNVAMYERARQRSEQVCLHHVTFPCSEGGDFTPAEWTSCLWKDSGKRHSGSNWSVAQRKCSLSCCASTRLRV